MDVHKTDVRFLLQNKIQLNNLIKKFSKTIGANFVKMSEVAVLLPWSSARSPCKVRGNTLIYLSFKVIIVLIL